MLLARRERARSSPGKGEINTSGISSPSILPGHCGATVITSCWTFRMYSRSKEPVSGHRGLKADGGDAMSAVPPVVPCGRVEGEPETRMPPELRRSWKFSVRGAGVLLGGIA